MGKPNPHFRINDNRAVFVTGTISQELIDRLTPQIRLLRAQGSQPITVYVDSVGGSTRIGGVLAGLLRCPGQDGAASRIITVVTNIAHSAAADILASGDYAVAYPEAIIHYHGTRQYYDEGITMEAAQGIADSLHEANEFFAIRLAERSIQRFMFLFLCERNSFHEVRKEIAAEGAPDVVVFCEILARKLSPHLDQLPFKALQDFEDAKALSGHVMKELKDVNVEEWGRTEAEVFRLILDYELKRNKGWTLTRGGLGKAVSDFVMFNDFTFGVQRKSLQKFVEKQWHLYVSGEEKQQLQERFGKSNEGQSNLLRHMEEKMEPFWHFVYSLCRRLQQGENSLTATDAYWLGIVDEVLGTQLPCVRELVENMPGPVTELGGSQPAASDGN